MSNTEKEKALELVGKFYSSFSTTHKKSLEESFKTNRFHKSLSFIRSLNGALIAVDEMVNVLAFNGTSASFEYWQKVKEELQELKNKNQ